MPYAKQDIAPAGESRPLDPEELGISTNGNALLPDSPTQGPNAGSMDSLKIQYGLTAEESPFAERPAGRAARGVQDVRGTSDDYYGAFSIETFCAQGSLSQTHEDAQGWLDYVGRFHTPNFWYKDSGVKPWAYYEDYDNWQDTYGIDAVNAVYHSGHGGMAGNGVFQLPMGADWGGLGCDVWSNRMRVGNEQANYIFFSTCESLRVLGGHSPIRTWSPANLGFRMLFGFETVSVDRPEYGRWFWDEWNTGKSFSTAWLDSSWRISHHQAPSAVACGATADEARNRLFNERLFSWDHVSTAWWQWRWYYAAAGVGMVREPNRALPKELLVARLRPAGAPEAAIRRVAPQLGVDRRALQAVQPLSNGAFALKDGAARLTIKADGSFEALLGQPNLENQDPLPVSEAQHLAEAAIRNFGLQQDVELMFDRVLLSYEAGGSDEGSGQREDPRITSTAVQYKQVINGLPVVTPGVGDVRVTLDNDGTVIAIRSATRPLDRLINRPLNTTASPDEDGPLARSRVSDAAGYEQALGTEWSKQVARWAVSGRMPLQWATVPGTTEVGYDLRNNDARLVVQREIEVDFGGGIRKRYQVVTPILE